MKLTLVDAYSNKMVTAVTDQEHAEFIFKDEPNWIGALLSEDDGTLINSFVRDTDEPHQSAYLSEVAIREILENRRKTREGTPGTRLGWDIPGYCDEISSGILEDHGIAKVIGNYMAKDLKTQICVHAWNVLPDLTIVDMTSDQFMDGANYRIVPKGHPDWLRYQPDFEEWEELCQAEGFSPSYLAYLEQQGTMINRTRPVSGLSYLHLPAASKAVEMELEPFVEEFLRSELEKHELMKINRWKFEFDSLEP